MWHVVNHTPSLTPPVAGTASTTYGRMEHAIWNARGASDLILEREARGRPRALLLVMDPPYALPV